MLSREDFSEIEKNKSLVENLLGLEKILREFEAQHKDTADYQQLNDFEKTTYGQFADFTTHTVGILSHLSLSMKTLLREPGGAITPEFDRIRKASVINKDFDPTAAALALHINKFLEVASLSSGHKEVCNTVLTQITAVQANVQELKRKLEALKKNDPPAPNKP